MQTKAYLVILNPPQIQKICRFQYLDSLFESFQKSQTLVFFENSLIYFCVVCDDHQYPRVPIKNESKLVVSGAVIPHSLA